MIALVNTAAVGLLIYALYRYVFVGPQGFYEGNEFRLRILWGGSTLLFGWLAVVGLLLERNGLRSYAMGLAGIFGIVIVNHRSGYVALIFAFAWHLMSSYRTATKRLVMIAVALVLAAAIVSAFSPTIRQSATYSLRTMFNPHADATANDRLQRTALAWDYVRAHPLGDYVWSGTFYLINLGAAGFEPHNFVIQTMDKQGLVAAALLFALILAAFRLGWRNRSRSRLSTVLMTYLVFYLSFCLFNTNFDALDNVTLLAITIALLLHVNQQMGRPSPTPIVAEGRKGSPPALEVPTM
jgi:hypothetical protein